MSTATNHVETSTLTGFMADGRSWIGHADEAATYLGPVPRAHAERLLDIPVVESRIFNTVITDEGVDDIEDETRKGIVRLDTREVFLYPKLGYKMHRYPQWLIEYVDVLLDGGLSIGTVAMTKGGARAFVQVELPDTREATAPGAEPVKNRPHLTAATSLDGSIATTYGVGTRVLICENELGLMSWRARVRSFSALTKVRHTSNSLSRVGEIRANLGLVAEEIGDVFDEDFRKLVSQYVSDSKWDDIVKAYTGVDAAKQGRSKTMAQNKVDALDELWTNDERVAPWRNSAYGVLAAFNTASHWIFGADKGRTQRNQDRTIDDEWAKQGSNILRMLETV